MINTRDTEFWKLESGDAVIAFACGGDGRLLQIWFGPALGEKEDYLAARETPVAVFDQKDQGLRYAIQTDEANSGGEPTIALMPAFGIGGFQLRLTDVEQGKSNLCFRLNDEISGLEINLNVASSSVPGLFIQSMELRNTANRPLSINRCLSLCLHLPSDRTFNAHRMTGIWGDELCHDIHAIDIGASLYGGTSISTGHDGSPWIAADHAGELAATENSGDLWYAALEWSGNWQTVAERPRRGAPRLQIGIHDRGFELVLEPGQKFMPPQAIFGFSRQGFNGMSSALHDYQRSVLAPRRGYIPPVVYNSWYATEFDVEIEQQVELAKIAKSIGVEMFVLDDGWFHDRLNDNAGLGNWWPDARKFPNGVSELAIKVREMGMKFGLWIEPEMVNINSDLYRAHPDWVLKIDGREQRKMRNQLMLNMALPEVQDHLIEAFTKLLKNEPIDFVKWDMNRGATEIGWGDANNPTISAYVHGMWRVWDALRQAQPDIIWENCSGGGGRLDWGQMSRAEQTWASDNVDPSSREHIQHSFTKLFPPETMASWVCDDPMDRASMDFRFHVAMQGALGVGGDLSKWSRKDLAIAKEKVKQWKGLRNLISKCTVHRISDPAANAFSALLYVSHDQSEAVLFASRPGAGRLSRQTKLMLNGLDINQTYRCSNGSIQSGRFWIEHGLAIELGHHESIILRFLAEKE